MNGLSLAVPYALVVALAPSVFGSAYGTPLAQSGAPQHELAQERNCGPAELPKALPPVETIVNVASLTSAIAADSLSRPSSDVTFSMRFLSNGQVAWVRPIGVRSPGEHARLQALVTAHTRLQSAAKEPWAVRVQITAGDSTRYIVSRSQECPVERVAANPGAVGTSVGMASMDDLRALRSSGEARAVVEVGSTGQILDVELVRSSGSRVQDEVILQIARESRYLPALVDGIPIVGRFEQRTRARTRTVRTRVH